jgi:hypothetical protein
LKSLAPSVAEIHQLLLGESGVAMTAEVGPAISQTDAVPANSPFPQPDTIFSPLPPFPRPVTPVGFLPCSPPTNGGGEPGRPAPNAQRNHSRTNPRRNPCWRDIDGAFGLQQEVQATKPSTFAFASVRLRVTNYPAARVYHHTMQRAIDTCSGNCMQWGLHAAKSRTLALARCAICA